MRSSTSAEVAKLKVPDELVDEVLRLGDLVTELAEHPQVDDPELLVPELVGLLGAELAVEHPLLKVDDLGLLLDPGEELDELAHDGGVDVGQSVPVRPVEVGEGLAVTVEDGDLVLSDHDVVVVPDVAWDCGT